MSVGFNGQTFNEYISILEMKKLGKSKNVILTYKFNLDCETKVL